PQVENQAIFLEPKLSENEKVIGCAGDQFQLQLVHRQLQRSRLHHAVVIGKFDNPSTGVYTQDHALNVGFVANLQRLGEGRQDFSNLGVGIKAQVELRRWA